MLKKARSLVLLVLVLSEAKNDILQFGEEFTSEPLISSSILSILNKVKTLKLKTF